MKVLPVILEPEAREDLQDRYDWISRRVSRRVALRYIERVENACEMIGVAREQGRPMDDVEPRLRMTGFERHHNICFFVRSEEVRIARVLFNGRDVRKAFRKR